MVKCQFIYLYSIERPEGVRGGLKGGKKGRKKGEKGTKGRGNYKKTALFW
jgi:hypothetical protein